MAEALCFVLSCVTFSKREATSGDPQCLTSGTDLNSCCDLDVLYAKVKCPVGERFCFLQLKEMTESTFWSLFFLFFIFFFIAHYTLTHVVPTAESQTSHFTAQTLCRGG